MVCLVQLLLAKVFSAMKSTKHIKKLPARMDDVLNRLSVARAVLKRPLSPINYPNNPQIVTYVRKQRTFFRLLSRLNEHDLCGLFSES